MTNSAINTLSSSCCLSKLNQMHSPGHPSQHTLLLLLLFLHCPSFDTSQSMISYDCAFLNACYMTIQIRNLCWTGHQHGRCSFAWSAWTQVEQCSIRIRGNFRVLHRIKRSCKQNLKHGCCTRRTSTSLLVTYNSIQVFSYYHVCQ